MAQDLTIAEMLREHTYPIELADRGLTGPGAQWLSDQAAGAQFVLVGEEHGTVEIPAFVQALLGQTRRLGFKYLAVETGPVSAEALQVLAQSPDPTEAILEHDQTLSARFPFYSEYEADARLLGVLAADSIALWGLDQEFLLGSPYLLQRLSDLAPSPEVRAEMEGMIQRERRGVRRMLADEDPSQLLLASVDPSDLEQMRTLFGPSVSPAANRILTQLELSRDIYRANLEGRAEESRLARAQLMKLNFRQHYEEAEGQGGSNPRVVFKMGAVHLGRGLSPLGVYDLGNSVAEWAALRGLESLHIAVVDNSMVLLEGAIPSSDPTWAVADLRPLRSHWPREQLDTSATELLDLARRYDVALVLPSLTRSDPLR